MEKYIYILLIIYRKYLMMEIVGDKLMIFEYSETRQFVARQFVFFEKFGQNFFFTFFSVTLLTV